MCKEQIDFIKNIICISVNWCVCVCVLTCRKYKGSDPAPPVI